MSSAAMKTHPIFVVGLTAKTGTNYLQRLLCLHERCTPSVLYEDFLMYFSGDLVRYANHLGEHYAKQNWSKTEPAFSDFVQLLLDHSLGGALLEFAAKTGQKSGRHVVLKTPSICGIESWERLCVRAPLVIMLRDGRSTVESMWRWRKCSFEEAVTFWVQGAEAFLDFRKRAGKSEVNYSVVRYEDVYLDTRKEMAQLLRFLRLPARAYPFERARRISVTHSSFYFGAKGRGTARAKSADFKPLWSDEKWDAKNHSLFEKLAGTLNRELGYR